ncbi:hypothetical protein VN24_05600 [Paenibacillus beijingensis]|uniref:Leucine-binding protein domain-containing protein n=2 Tax=Paenibacillus beijingensis TaxID=1126833 RepID=A0A0D5NQQ9_9BACL|nr:hypothetical protein VN24_05600 [Paenibacillus beijingensis]
MIAVLLVTACGKQSSGSGAGEDQVKEVSIGLVAPITGNRAQYGKSFSNAAQMAIDDYNAKNPNVKVKLVKADSKDDPKEGANIAQKFADDDAIRAVVGDFSSTTSMAGSPIYQRSGLVQLSPTASHPDFTKTGDFIFRNVDTQEIEGGFVADYAKELGYSKAAVIYIQNDWGLSAKDSFEKKFKENGGDIVSSLNFNPDTKDFNNILIKIREQNPDVIYLGSPYTESALIAKQSRTLGLNVPVIGTGILYSKEFIELGGTAVEGAHTSSYFFPEDPRPAVKTFADAYKQKFNDEPDMFAALAYDSVNMILAVIEQGATDRKGIRDGLAGLKDFAGVTGKTAFDENRNVNKELTKLEVKDGTFILYKKE